MKKKSHSAGSGWTKSSLSRDKGTSELNSQKQMAGGRGRVGKAKAPTSGSGANRYGCK